MKGIKKSLYCLTIGAIILAMSLCFVSCGKSKKEVNLNKSVKSEIDTTISYLTEKAYNKKDVLGTSTTYTTAQAKEKLADFKYYVKVADLKNFDDIDKIEIGDETFKKDSEISLSIGNSNFIKDKVWKIDNDSLYVAAPVMAFELAQDNEISIGDKDIDLKDIDTAKKINFTAVKFNGNSSNTVSKVNGKENEYDITINNSNTWLGLTYPNAKSTDIALTKKVYKYGDKTSSVSYGLTAVENTTEMPVAFYPVSYNTDGGKVTETLHSKFQNSSVDYKVYIVGNGMAEAKLNIKLNYTENA